MTALLSVNSYVSGAPLYWNTALNVAPVPPSVTTVETGTCPMFTVSYVAV